MDAGTGSRRSGRGRRACARVAGVALAASLAGGGCAAIDPAAARAEREAALARWSGCVARHAARGTTPGEALEATRVGCDGHRRDVTATFAPHLADRVRARLDAGERRRVMHERLDLDRVGLGDRSGSPGAWLERLLIRTAEDRGDERGGERGGARDGARGHGGERGREDG